MEIDVNVTDVTSVTSIMSPNHTTMSSNGTILPPSDINVPPCSWILFKDIGDSRVRIWDTIILIPNALFLIFLLLRLRSAVAKLATTSSPIFLAFYGLVFLVAVISVLRCIVSMTVNASLPTGDIVDKVLWLILRFFLLATESSVVVFGLAFGHLDSRTSIRRVLAVTFALSLLYSTIQGTLEFMYPDPKFRVTREVKTENYDLFAHGGMIFWFTGSFLLFIVYTVIFVLPYTSVRQRLSLPAKRSFYWYCAFLSVLNLVQAIGSVLLYNKVQHCMCVVNLTAFLYFTLYNPLVYWTFLREFFKHSSPGILYSYKPQHDEVIEEDSVVMPYQSPYNHDEAYLSNSYNSTHFDDTDAINGNIATRKNDTRNFIGTTDVLAYGSDKNSFPEENFADFDNFKINQSPVESTKPNRTPVVTHTPNFADNFLDSVSSLKKRKPNLQNMVEKSNSDDESDMENDINDIINSPNSDKLPRKVTENRDSNRNTLNRNTPAFNNAMSNNMLTNDITDIQPDITTDITRDLGPLRFSDSVFNDITNDNADQIV